MKEQNWNGLRRPRGAGSGTWILGQTPGVRCDRADHLGMMEGERLGHLGAVRASGHEDTVERQLVSRTDRSYERRQKPDVVRPACHDVVVPAVGPTDETLPISGWSPLRIDHEETLTICNGSKDRQRALPNFCYIESISSTAMQDEHHGSRLRHFRR